MRRIIETTPLSLDGIIGGPQLCWPIQTISYADAINATTSQPNPNPNTRTCSPTPRTSSAPPQWPTA